MGQRVSAVRQAQEAKRKSQYPKRRVCTICGEPFYVDWPRRDRKTCSDECWRQAGVRAKRGPLNPGWKGGGPSQPAWREAKEKRCRNCGKPGRMFLHHVIYEQHVRAKGGNAFDPRDSLTLCFQCHMAHHHGADNRIPVSKLRPENLEFACDLLGVTARDYFVRYYDVDVLIDVLMGDVMSRWVSLSDEEVRVLWDGLTMDDGIRYGVEATDQPTYTLVRELARESVRRRLDLPTADDYS